MAEKGGGHGEHVAYIYALPSAVLRVFRLPLPWSVLTKDPDLHSRPERTRNTENASRRGGADVSVACPAFATHTRTH